MMQDRKVFPPKEIHKYQKNIKCLFIVYYNILDYCIFSPKLKNFEKYNWFEYESLDSPWRNKYKRYIVKIIPYKINLDFH